MANTFIKTDQVVNTQLGVLERELVLPALVWRDAIPSFKGAKDDTVSIRIPAYTSARRRVLRSGTLPLVVDGLGETKVDVVLDMDIYKIVGVTLEQLTLDVTDFNAQVATPVTGSMVREIEDALTQEIDESDPAVAFANISSSDPYGALVDARMALNRAHVPMQGRFLAVGANVEGAILKSDRLSKFDQSGSSDALREASIGRIAGFTAVSAPTLHPDSVVAAHKSAFVLQTVAPAVPQGAVKGSTASFEGFALTVIQDYDSLYMQDRYGQHVFAGTATTLDRGYFNSRGQWEGVTDPAITSATDRYDSSSKTVGTKLIRAVKLSLGGIIS